MILRNEKASAEYTTQNLTRIYCEEGKGVFTVRSNVLGHMQQGGSPSPFDRNLGTELASKATHWMVQVIHGDKLDLVKKNCLFSINKHTVIILNRRF